MEEVIDRQNLNRAYRRVKANKGAPGVDGMTLRELGDWIAQQGMNNAWLRAQGLIELTPKYLALQQ
jgi:hypothetical protein